MVRRDHRKSECLKRKREEQQRNKQCNVAEDDDELVFMTSVESIPEANLHEMSVVNFIVDSGATNHLVTKEMDSFLIESRSVNQKIKVAKQGEVVTAHKEGTLLLETSKGKKVKLENVLLCDTLTHNLLSVKKIEEAKKLFFLKWTSENTKKDRMKQ